MESELKTDAQQIFEEALSWLKENYNQLSPFYVERDIVWTIQNKIREIIKGKNLTVFNDYPILKGENNKRALSADIAIINEKGEIELAVEFKFEPSDYRKDKDIPKKKFPIVDWKDIRKDVKRIKDFVESSNEELSQEGKRPKLAYAILIDEGGHFKKKIEEEDKQEVKEYPYFRIKMYSKSQQNINTTDNI